MQTSRGNIDTSQISGYIVVSAATQQTFNANIAQAIADGYTIPYGEPKLEQPTGNFHGFFQVMLKPLSIDRKVTPPKQEVEL